MSWRPLNSKVNCHAAFRLDCSFSNSVAEPDVAVVARHAHDSERQCDALRTPPILGLVVWVPACMAVCVGRSVSDDNALGVNDLEFQQRF